MSGSEDFDVESPLPGVDDHASASQPWRGPQIKLEKFSGDRALYRAWRDEVQAILLLHSVPPEKQVLLLY